MEKKYFEEMIANLKSLEETGALSGCDLFVFGHCEASLKLIDELLHFDSPVKGILDNSREKQGILYRDIPVLFPEAVIENTFSNAVVLIVTRFYEQMKEQLLNMGFAGKIVKLVDYNSYAEYSLSYETRHKKLERVERGEKTLADLKKQYMGSYLVFCPYNALGDVCFCMSYIPEFIKKRGKNRYAIVLPSKACSEVARLFGANDVVVLEQDDLDAAVQAALYSFDEDVFIAHQDRPYVINLHKALAKKLIPLEKIYRVGIFGLNNDVKPAVPSEWADYAGLDEIEKGNAAILSPYAKSVPALPESVWKDIVEGLKQRNMEIFTNTIGDERPLPGTKPITPNIREMKSVVEYAGLFIGIRSGLCDILRTANCRKIALFPDYNYGDTMWKAIDMYSIDGFENILVGEDYKWRMN